MSADNVMVVAKFPQVAPSGETQGYQFRVAELMDSGLPYAQRWAEDGTVQLPARVQDVENLVAAFERAKVFTEEGAARAEAHRLCEEDYVEYGCSWVVFDKPWEEYVQEAQARVAKRKGRPRREKQLRRLERTDAAQYLRDHARVIRWHERGLVFMCGDTAVSPQLLGKLMVQAQINGEEEVRLLFSRRYATYSEGWSEGFSLAYLNQMLEWVRDRGWFWDEVGDRHSTRGDHEFDGKAITPGLNWKQVCDLRQSAAAMVESATSYERMEEPALAAYIRRLAQETRQLAEKLLAAGLPTYRKGRRWR